MVGTPWMFPAGTTPEQRDEQPRHGIALRPNRQPAARRADSRFGRAKRKSVNIDLGQRRA
jgi:hypothetical protein